MVGLTPKDLLGGMRLHNVAQSNDPENCHSMNAKRTGRARSRASREDPPAKRPTDVGVAGEGDKISASSVAILPPKQRQRLAGTQTLVRGLDVIDAIANGAAALPELAAMIGLTRSTTHRLAATLVERRYLDFSRRDGYALGPKLLELGYVTGRRNDLPRVAREQLEQLAAITGDTVHLGILEGTRALYLDKIAGSRRVEISSRIGERQPLRSTGLGKALILDADEKKWCEYYDNEARSGSRYDVPLEQWLLRMRSYAQHGYAFDLEENEDRIRCVAAPIRGVDGSIVAAISVSSAAQYMDDVRMRGLIFDVKKAADAIGTALGFNPATVRRVRSQKTS
jgi:DNA-binding IclR family transcriptional regulator